MRRLTAAALSVLLWPGVALAHGGATEGGGFVLWTALLLVAAALAYAAGVRAVRGIGSPIFTGGRIVAFAGGILCLWVALEPPLDPLGGELFAAHMVQHLLLMLAAAPLLAWARPLLAFYMALPPRPRRAVGRWWARGRWLKTTYAALAHPAAVWLGFCGLFAFWHLPGPYGWALRSAPLHVLEHASFLASAFAFWSVVLDPAGAGRLDHGARLLYLTGAAILSGLPGALMILTQRAFYLQHAEGAARWGLTPLADQQLAGLVMWIPAGLVYLAAAAWLFLGWLHRAARGPRGRRAGSGVALSLLLIAAGGAKAAAPTGGDPGRGGKEIVAQGCGACHIIPGIAGANGLVGPPLDHMGRRIYLAGLLRNNPGNMVRWLQHPQEILPGGAMPDQGLSEEQARNIAAYLFTLH
jgi:putative membrane protein